MAMEFHGIKELLKTVNPVIDYDTYGNPIKTIDDYTLINEVDCIGHTISAVNERIDCAVASLECRVNELESVHSVRANDFYPRIENISTQLRDTSSDVRNITLQVRNLQTQFNTLSSSMKNLEHQLRALTAATTEKSKQKSDLEKVKRIDDNPFLNRNEGSWINDDEY